jgi:hypothetical protein
LHQFLTPQRLSQTPNLFKAPFSVAYYKSISSESKSITVANKGSKAVPKHKAITKRISRISANHAAGTPSTGFQKKQLTSGTSMPTKSTSYETMEFKKGQWHCPALAKPRRNISTHRRSTRTINKKTQLVTLDNYGFGPVEKQIPWHVRQWSDSTVKKNEYSGTFLSTVP